MSARVRARLGFLAGLPRFLRDNPDGGECARLVAHHQARRAEALVEIFERAVFANPHSPYLPLLERAGIELGDVVAMVAGDGVERTLEQLYAAGVRISIDEFKGRVPIARPGLELHARPEDFDNPLLRRHFEASTGGSRGPGSRLAIDLGLLAHESAYLSLCLRGFGIEAMPFIAWRPVPPGLAGFKGMLRRAHLGLPATAWYTPYRHPRRPANLKFALLTGSAVAASRLSGPGIPRPRYAPLDRGPQIAELLAGFARAGTPAHLDTSWSSAVRVCRAADELGLDLAGTFFRVGGEPTTVARQAAIEAVGGRFAVHYSMGEVGWIGLSCPHRREPDEVHVMTDKLAVIQPPAAAAGGAGNERALVLTTLLAVCPKVLINVDTGDHATLATRACGCPAGELGMYTVAHSIASHEKLTTEGMSFVASELAWLLEQALPARFGGAVGDYQLVEDRSGALTRIRIVVDPAIGAAPESAVVAAALECLAGLGEGQRMMAEQWAQSGVLGVERRVPYRPSDKQPLLHVIEAGAQAL